MENNELYHFGIPGMKWGLRRFQNYDGSLTPEGREHYGVKGTRTGGFATKLKAKFSSNKELKRKQESEKRLKEAENRRKAHEEHVKAREKAINSGSAQDVMKFKDELTLEQKQKIYQRLLADDNIARMARGETEAQAKAKEAKSLTSKLERFNKFAEATASTVDKGSKLYNNAAKVINAFTDMELPMIGEKKNVISASQKMAKQLAKEFKDMPLDKISEKDLKRYNEAANKISYLQTIEKAAKGEQVNYTDFKKNKEEEKKTTSQRVAENQLKILADKSSKEIANLSPKDLNKLSNLTETLSTIQALEKISKGQNAGKGKKKGDDSSDEKKSKKGKKK